MELDKIRALAGLPVLTEGKKKKDADLPPADDVDVDAPPADDAAPKGKKGKGEKTEEEKLQEMLEKMAKKAEGKDADALVGIFRKVYDAGVKDGIAQASDDKVSESVIVEQDGELDRLFKALDALKTNIDKAKIKSILAAAHKAGKLG